MPQSFQSQILLEINVLQWKLVLYETGSIAALFVSLEIEFNALSNYTTPSLCSTFVVHVTINFICRSNRKVTVGQNLEF